jgi:putative transposase
MKGHELDVFLQKRRNKKAAIRFLSRLLKSYPNAESKFITDKLNSYKKPIKFMRKTAEHRSHKGLNNRIENAHQPTRSKEKCLIKFKSPLGGQRTLSLMGKLRNLFAVEVGRYTKEACRRKECFQVACSIWCEAAQSLL